MSDNRIHLVPGVLVENFGDNVMVSLPDRSEVLSLTGDMAEIVVALRDGEEVSPNNGDALTELERRGVITLADSKGVSRRQILTAGAAGVTGGVLALSLPAAAAASSFVCPVVTGALQSVTPVSTGDGPVYRVNMTVPFSPLGIYWLAIYDSFDGTSRGILRGFEQVDIQLDEFSGLIRGEVSQDDFPGLTSDDRIYVLFSDPNKLCEVGELAVNVD